MYTWVANFGRSIPKHWLSLNWTARLLTEVHVTAQSFTYTSTIIRCFCQVPFPPSNIRTINNGSVTGVILGSYEYGGLLLYVCKAFMPNQSICEGTHPPASYTHKTDLFTRTCTCHCRTTTHTEVLASCMSMFSHYCKAYPFHDVV